MLSTRCFFSLRVTWSSDKDAEPELDFGHLHFDDDLAGQEEPALAPDGAADAEQPGATLELETLPVDDAGGTSGEPLQGFSLDDAQLEELHGDREQAEDAQFSEEHEEPGTAVHAAGGEANLAPSSAHEDLVGSGDSGQDFGQDFGHDLGDDPTGGDDGDLPAPDFEMTAAGSRDSLENSSAREDAAPTFRGRKETLVEYPPLNGALDQGSSSGDVDDRETLLDSYPDRDSPTSLNERFDTTQPVGDSEMLEQLTSPEFSPGPSLQGEQAGSGLKLQSNPGLDSGNRSTGSSSSGQFQGEFQGFGMESQGGEKEPAGNALDLELDAEEDGVERGFAEEEGASEGGGSGDEGGEAGDDFRLTFGDSAAVGDAGGPVLPTGGQTGADLTIGEHIVPAGPVVDLENLGANPSALVKPPLPVQGNRAAPYVRAGKWALTFAIASVMTAAICVLAFPYVFSKEELRVLARELSLEDTFETVGLLDPEVAVSMPTFEELPASAVAPVGIPPVLVPSPNESYFQEIIGFIRSGEPYEAAAAMKKPPQVALRMRYDLDMSSMAAARLNLLLAQSEKAAQALHHRCVTHVVELSAEICVHYVRALVGTGRYGEARSLLARLHEARDHDLVSEELTMTGRVLAAVEPRTPLSLAQYFLDFINAPSHDYEWDRQESLWLLKEIGNLDVSRWRDLAQILFQLRRSEIIMRLQSAEFAKEKIKSAMGLTWFLDFLAVRYGFEILGFEHGNRILPAADHRFAVVARVLASSVQGGSEVDQSLLHGIRSKRPYSEIERLMTINMSMQDRQLGKVYHLMNAHMDLILRGQFSFEWKLLGAHYAVEIGNATMAAKLYRTFKALAKGKEEYVRSFDFWYTMSKLAAFHNEDPLAYVERARPFAFSEREQGLLEAVRIAWFAKKREFDKLNVSLTVKKYPWHYRVLSAAILAQGHAGRDPKKFIEMQNRVSSSRIAEGREKNLLTDYTVRVIIQKI